LTPWPRRVRTVPRSIPEPLSMSARRRPRSPASL
jgi:hypothetical protein